jgi:hypothetical protein
LTELEQLLRVQQLAGTGHGQVAAVVGEVRASAHRDQPDRSIVITGIGRS